MVDWPLYFFCSNCGKIHEITWKDLHDETWFRVMNYIHENIDPDSRLLLPDSKEIAKEFGFTRRNAQYYLKEYRLLMYSLFGSFHSKELRSGA